MQNDFGNQQGYNNDPYNNGQYDQQGYNNNVQYNDQQYYQQPVMPPMSCTSVLVWGIVGLALSCTFYLGIIGIIISAIGMSKAKAYFSYGVHSTQAKVGKILSIVGLILGIVFTVILVILIAALVSVGMYY